MCGIAGYFGPPPACSLTAMIELLAHRGPDDRGVFEDTGIGLANARLKIVDLRGGHQPLCGEESRVWVTFNGEIFNHRPERLDLEARGHRFLTNADTEVLVHLYEEYGIDFVGRLNGMFALALWDTTAKQLLLARDYVGMKPLYYSCVGNGTLAFASEIKALLPLQLTVEPNIASLPDFLRLGYVPSNETMFTGIRKVRPGQVLKVSRQGVELDTYHNFNPQIKATSSEHQAEAVLARELNRATRDWLMSDVPVGAYLSGGIDSSLIAALAASEMDSRLHTYTAWFGPEYANELEAAELVARFLSVDHSSIAVSADDVLREMKSVAWAYDEPIADAAIFPTYFVARVARRDVRVVISGEGGDELFGGYPWHRIFPYVGRIYDHGQGDGGPRMPPCPGHFLPKVASLALPGYPFAQRYLDFIAIFGTDEVRDILPRGGAGSALRAFSEYMNLPTGSSLSRLLLCDTMTRLSESYLMKADKGCMAHSVEERPPYLDKSFMELAFSMPDHLKIAFPYNKVILRKIAKGVVPTRTVNRRKQGYGVPVAGWVRGQIGDQLVNLIETSVLIKDGLDRNAVAKVVAKRSSRPHQFWLLGALALWDQVVLAPYSARMKS